MIMVFMINMLFTTFAANVASFYLIKEDHPTFEAFPLNFETFLYDCFFLIATNPIFSTFLVIFLEAYNYSLAKLEENILIRSQIQVNLKSSVLDAVGREGTKQKQVTSDGLQVSTFQRMKHFQ